MPSSKPVAGYRRLTSDRHGNKIGYQVQTEAAELWAAQHGYRIEHWYTDPDVTAGDEDVWREEYEQMLLDLQGGRWGGIVVMHMDRLTRLTFEYERTLKIARRAGGFIACTSDNSISLEETGEMSQRMRVMFAQSELNQMKRRIKANKQKRSKGGEYHGGGKRPYGFLGPEYDESGEKVINTGLVGVVHVPFEIARLQEAARRIAWESESYTDVIKDWHAQTPPVYGSTGSPWTTKTLETILLSPRMVGRRLYRVVDTESGKLIETEVQAVWEPVIDERTWQQLRAMKRTVVPRNSRSYYPLSGLARCGRCEGPLTGVVRDYRRGGEVVPVRGYRCRSHPTDKAKGYCGKLNVLADEAERHVLSLVFERLMRTKGLVAGVSEQSDIQAEMAEAGEEIKLCDAELAALDEAQGDRSQRLTVKSWLAARTPLLDQREEAASRLKSLQAQMAVPSPAGDDFDDLVGWFEKLKLSQKTKFVRAHVQSVAVLPTGRTGRYFNPDRLVVRLAGAQ